MTIRIVTDSTCDLPKEIAAQHGITVVPLYINFGGESYLDGIARGVLCPTARLRPAANDGDARAADVSRCLREAGG